MPRVLSEDEYNALRASVLKAAPDGLSEQEFARYVGPAMEQALGQAENTSPTVEGSALSRFASGAWKNLNPIAAVEGLYQAARHPIDTAGNILAAQGGQLAKAKAAYQGGQPGSTVEAAGHLAAAALPVIGPMAANAGERIASGDVAGGLGEGAALAAPMAAADAAKALGNAWGVVPKTSREIVADRLKAIANEKVADVMAPKVGPNKVRFGNQAAQVAPELLQRGDVQGFSREALQNHIEGKLAEAETALDQASAARNPNQVVYTGPIVGELNRAKAALTAQTHQTQGLKAGASVVPSPNAARVAVLDQAIDEIKQLGPVANYEALRRIRQAYDGPAKAVYNPSITQDFLKAQGGKMGAADVTGTLRQALAKMDPQTAAANADYSLYRKANDVLAATEEVQRTRPKVGRQILARLTGSVVGEQAAGIPGAAAGFVLGPVLDQAVNAGVTTKLQTANLLHSLASAIRNGQTGSIAGLSARLKAISRAALAGVAVDQASAPTEADALPTTP